MSRVADRLAALSAAGRKALVTFITAGDPLPAATVPAMHALVAGGADVIELGMPFSDPEADGPAVQAGSERALRAGTTLAEVFDMVARFRLEDRATPVLLMGYLNTAERIGYEEFAARAAKAGVDGTIFVNLPPEEATDLRAAYATHGLDSVFLIAPTSTPERVTRIARASTGFIYYVSLKGVTGADHLAVDDVAGKVAAIKRVAQIPVMVGFGIKDGASAARVARYSDGVVVGSALVNTMGAHADDPESIPDLLSAQVRDMRLALDGGT